MSAVRGTRRRPYRRPQCACDHENALCRCGHRVNQHQICNRSGTWPACEVHGSMTACNACECRQAAAPGDHSGQWLPREGDLITTRDGTTWRVESCSAIDGAERFALIVTRDGETEVAS